MNYSYHTNIKDHPHLRQSFFNLALDTFNIDFKPWFEKGYWTSAYKPHGWFLGDKMVSNASANHMSLLINQEKISAIQIGTVMTHKDHRKLGLAKKLIENIIEEYQASNSFFYLFADNDAREFYKKLGFRVYKETDYSTDFESKTERNHLRKLDLSLEEDHYIFDVISKQQVLFKSDFEMVQKPTLSGFYGYLIYRDYLYLDEETQTIYILKDKGDLLELIDIIQTRPLTLESHLEKIVHYKQRVHFHFKPEPLSTEIQKTVLESDGPLMVYGLKVCLPSDFRFKATNQA